MLRRSRFCRFYRWVLALVIVTSTPGLGELLEGAAHAAIGEVTTAEHHEDRDTDCGDSCPDGDCSLGFFHGCRCNASLMLTSRPPHGLVAPLARPATHAVDTCRGDVVAGFPQALFRPPRG